MSTRRIGGWGLALCLVATSSSMAQIAGVQKTGEAGKRETTQEIMDRQAVTPSRPRPVRPEREVERYPKANPAAPAASRWPADAPTERGEAIEAAPQTVGVTFDGPTLTDTGAFPPDTMGTVGPTQFVGFLNGRLRTYTKAGAADGVINADPDVFFASVMTPVGGSVVLNFTSDPNVRFL